MLQSLVARPIKEAAFEERLRESVRRTVSAHVIAHAPRQHRTDRPQSSLAPSGVKAGEHGEPGGVVRVSVPKPEWAWLDSIGRPKPEPPDGVRNEFQRDRDRIIHCTAFRRLQHKTQVFASYGGRLLPDAPHAHAGGEPDGP